MLSSFSCLTKNQLCVIQFVAKGLFSVPNQLEKSINPKRFDLKVKLVLILCGALVCVDFLT